VLQHTFDITVQAPGIATFSTPAPMTFPNVFNAPPGSQLNFLSFDHTTGRLVIEGTATVSADGLSVRTDPGTGITHPGWHGLTPPGGPNDRPCPPRDGHDPNLQPEPVTDGLQDYFFSNDNGSLRLSFGNAAPRAPDSDKCSEANLRATPLIVEFFPDAWAEDFLQGDALIRFPLELYPGQQRSIRLRTKKLLVPATIAKAREDMLYGTRLRMLLYAKGRRDAPFLDKTIYIYRFFDIADRVHDDGTMTFQKTLADGAAGVERRKHVRFAMLEASVPTLALPPTAKEFSVNTGFSEAVVTFDPANFGTRDLALTIASPNGARVGGILLLGDGLASQRILFAKSDLAEAIRQVVDPDVYISGTKSFVDKFFREPFADPQGTLIRSTNAAFASRVDLVYDLIRTNTLSIFAQSAPRLDQAIELVDANIGPGIVVNWKVGRKVAEPSIQVSNALLGQTGSAVDIQHRTNMLFWILGSRLDPGTQVTLSLESAPSEIGPWTVLRSGFNIRRNLPNRPDRVSFPAPGDKWFRAVSTHLGPGLATYDVLVISRDINPCGGTFTPACAVWTDFQRESFTNQLVVEAAMNSKPQTRHWFSDLSNTNYNDVNPADPSFQGVMMIFNELTDATNITGNIASALAHEVGHDLGAIHMRDRLHDYIGGDVMGSEGVRAGKLPTFQKLLPMIKTGLGVPVSDAEFEDLFGYYKRFIPLEHYAFAPGLPLPGHDESEFEESLPILSVLERMPSVGEEVPAAIRELDFRPTPADGAGGDSSRLTLVVFNAGDADLNVTRMETTDASFVVEGVDPLPWLLPPMNVEDLQPNLSGRLVAVRFDPSRSGAHEAALVIDSDSLEGERTEVTLRGEAVAPGPSLETEVGNNNLGGVPIGQAGEANQLLTLRSVGKQPVVITSIRLNPDLNAAQFALLGLPDDPSPARPLSLAPGASVILGARFQPAETGLHRGEIEIHSNDAARPVRRVRLVATGLAPSGKPLDSLDYGDDFVAMESPDFPESPVLRARTDAGGNFEFFLAPDQSYHAVIFDPVSGLVAHLGGITAPSGQNTFLGTPVFLASTTPDSDGDGLPDDAEFAMGTNPNKADTDGDGIDDFASVSSGLDPLGGRAMPVGIVGQLRLDAEAELRADVNKAVVITPGGDLTKPIALLAAGKAGLAVVDVKRPTQPVLLNRLRLEGDALDVGADAELGIAIVAAGDAGLYLIDTADPASPTLLKTLCSWKADQVEVAQGVAYVVGGFDGWGITCVAFDLMTGQALQTIPIPGNPISGMAREGTMLYLTERSGSNVRLVDISERNMRLRGSLSVGAPFVRSPLQSLAVGNGVAYVTLSGSTEGSGGYATVDVSNPDALKVIAGTGVPPRNLAPGLSVALNGSGVGVLIGSLRTGVQSFTHVLDVMDVSDPTNTFAVIRRIDLPSAPRDVTINEGLAYVACGTNGLVIVNYLPFDGESRPPTVAISSGAGDADPTRPGLQGIEGTVVPVKAAIRDDVQVARVELLVNGQVVQTSTSFPFDLAAVTPPANGNAVRLSVQVRATDTGGNIGVSDRLALETMNDARVLDVESIDPAHKHVVPTDYGVIDVAFTKPILPDVATFENFYVLNSQGQAMRLRGLEWAEQGRLVRMRWEEFPPGDYTVGLRSANIRDFSGNALGAVNRTHRFTTHPFTMRWTGAAGPTKILDPDGPIRPPYAWRNPANWCPARVPGPDDSVFINVPRTNSFSLGLFTITTNIVASWVGDHDANFFPKAVELRCLVSNEGVSLVNVDLRVREFIQVNDYLDYAGSALRDTLLIDGTDNILRNRSPGPTPLRTADGYAAVLDRVTLRGDFQIECGAFAVKNHLTVQGNVRNRKNAFGNLCTGGFRIDRDAVIDGPGTVHDLGFLITFPELATDVFSSQRLVTINSNVTFRGHFDLTIGTGSKLINRGQFLFDELTSSDRQTGASSPANFSTILLGGYTNSVDSYQTFINEGTIEVSNSYRLGLNGNFDVFVNRGTLRVRDSSRLRIGASFYSPRTICDPGGICELMGPQKSLFTEPGQVSELSGAGRWFSRKEFRGGTVRLTDGAVLEGSAVFNDVSFEGELHNYHWQTRSAELPELLGSYTSDIYFGTNVTLNGLIQFHRKGNENGGFLLFGPGPQRLQGNGRIEFEGASSTSQIGQAATGGSVPLYLTIGPGITIHGASLTFGYIAGVSPVSQPLPFVDNQGAILTQPGDYLFLSTSGFTNSGVVHMASNTVVIAYRDFAQAASGRLEFEAAGTTPGTNHGQLKIGGRAHLDGTLAVQSAAAYQPKSGDALQLLTYTAVAGTFSGISAPPLAGDLTYQPVYGATNFALVVRAPGEPDPVQGPGHALEYSDSTGPFGTYVFQVSNPQLNTLPLTITAWVKTGQRNGTYRTIVAKYDANARQGYALALDNGRVSAWYYANSANYLWDGGAGLNQRFIADDRWHHVAYTADSSGGRIYIDGALANTHSWVGTPGPTQTSAIPGFGAYSGSLRLNGQLDEITVWQRALSADELQQNKNLLLKGNESGLLGYWHFDEGSGERAHDASGHGFDATVGFGSGAAKWVESTAPVKGSP
jgi:hypothetical protein